MTDSRGCEHEGTKVETASNRLNGVADPEGATVAPADLYESRFFELVQSQITDHSIEFWNTRVNKVR